MSTLAFNSYASTYDEHFTSSPIGMLQRKRVYHYLIPFLNKQKKVLEINCGTGYDAVHIAPLVKQVHATDISEGMVAEAVKKSTGIQNIIFETADTRTIHKRLAFSYDLIFSNFGGLNCLAPHELKTFAKNISPFISEKGTALFVVMGKKCLWEDLFFFLTKDKRLGRRKNVDGVETTIANENFKTYYYSPAELAGFFEAGYKTVLVRPIGLFIPPSYLNPLFLKKNLLLKILTGFEKIFGGLSFTANYADHFLLILQKK